MWWPGTPGLPRHWGGEGVLPGASLAHARVREAKRCHGEASAASRTIIPPWHLSASGAATLTHEQELDTQGCSAFAHFSKKSLTATKGQIVKKNFKTIWLELRKTSCSGLKILFLVTMNNAGDDTAEVSLKTHSFVITNTARCPSFSFKMQVFCCHKHGWKLSRSLVKYPVGTQTWTMVTSLAALLPLTPPPSPQPPYIEVG